MVRCLLRGHPWPNRYSSCYYQCLQTERLCWRARVRSRIVPACVLGAKSLRIDGGLLNFSTIKLGKARYRLY